MAAGVGDFRQDRQILITAKLVDGVVAAQTGPVDHGPHGFAQRCKSFPGKLEIIKAKRRRFGNQDDHVAVDDGVHRRTAYPRRRIDECVLPG